MHPQGVPSPRSHKEYKMNTQIIKCMEEIMRSNGQEHGKDIIY